MTRRFRHPSRRRAVATTMALMLIVLVAVALAAMTSRLATSARQTRQQQDQAQIRQLLHAGAQFARTNPAEGNHSPQLPAPLKDQGAQLTIEIKGKEATMHAAVGRHRAAQVVTVEGGKIVGVRLLD
jgi:type II secretory pathway pseudopilin PulG